MNLCKSCNFENPDGLEYCDQCLAPLEANDISVGEDELIPLGLGQVLDMRYIITSDVEDLSFGDVFIAEDAADESIVSLCLLHENVVCNTEAIEKLKTAQQKLTGFSNERLLGLLDVSLEGQRKFLVFEKTDGCRLSDKIADMPLSVEDSLSIFTQVAEAIDYVHSKGLIHGDVEPANIHVYQDGAVKLVFPLISRIIKDVENQDASDLNAPEVAAAGSERRSDIFSFAACIYNSLGGSLDQGRFMSLGILSEDQNTALKNALSPDPICRQATCGELLKDLGVDITRLQWKAPQLYNISISAGQNGRVFLPTRPNARFDPETEIQVKAIADDHYKFVNWTGSAVRAGKVEDENSPVTKLLVDADYTLIANFQIDRHELKLSSSDGGMVTTLTAEGGLYDFGCQIPMTVQPDENHHFVKWSGTAVDNGYISNPTDPAATLTIQGDCELVAEFTIDTFVFSLECSDGGFVKSDQVDVFSDSPSTGEYISGSEVTVSANADDNYTFVEWTGSAIDAGMIPDPKNPQVTLKIIGEYTLNAIFAISNHQLDISSSDGGVIAEPAGNNTQFDHGQSVALRAVADDSSHFVKWTGSAVDNGKVEDSSSAVTSVVVNADYDLKAVFEINRYSLTFEQADGGAVKTLNAAAEDYAHGTKVVVVAQADDNHHFVEWTGSAVDAKLIQPPLSKETTVTVEGDLTLKAIFALDSHVLNLTSIPGGTVMEPAEGFSEYQHGTEVTINAEPDTNYHFVKWAVSQDDEDKIDDKFSARTTVKVDRDISLEAIFEINQYCLNLTSSGNGSVSTPDDRLDGYTHGVRADIEAVPTENNHFVEWTGPAVESGLVDDCKSARTSVLVEGEINLEAVFALDQKTIIIDSNDGGLVVVPGAGKHSFDYGQQIEIECYPDDRYDFVAWSGSAVDYGKVADTTSPKTTVLLDGDCEIKAVFEKNKPFLKYLESAKTYAQAQPKSRLIAAAMIAAMLFVASVMGIVSSARENRQLNQQWQVIQDSAGSGELQDAIVTASKLSQRSEDFALDQGIDEKIAEWTKLIDAENAFNQFKLLVSQSEYDLAIAKAQDIQRDYPETEFVEMAFQQVETLKQKANIKGRIAKAVSLMNEAKIDEAKVIIDGVLKSAPDNAQAALVKYQLQEKFDAKTAGIKSDFISSADDFEKEKKWDEAIESYTKALEISPQDKMLKEKLASARHQKHLSLAGIFVNEKQYQAAIESYMIALSFKKSDKVSAQLESARKALKDINDKKLADKLALSKHDWNLARAIESKAAGKDQQALKFFEIALSAKENKATRKQFDSLKIELAMKKELADKQAQIADYLTKAKDAEAKGKLKDAFNAYKKAADLGSAEAIVAVGDAYYKGESVKHDPAKAVQWFKKAADQDYPPVYSRLGLAFAEGKGRKRNLPAALKYFNKGADLGCGRSMYYLGKCYHNGDGIKKDIRMAKKWLEKSADAGDAWAMHNLAIMYHNGSSIARDPERALKFYEKAANAGDVDAMYNLGVIYIKGDSVDKDVSRAMWWFARSAESGNVGAKLRLGLAYLDGNVVKTNYKAAHKWLSQAALDGNTDAMDRLGDMYIKGLGVESAPDKALNTYTSAAKAGHSNSMYKLALVYHEGRYVKQDYNIAAKWFSSAAAKGNRDSMYLLALLYKDGNGVKADKTISDQWLTKAAKAGHAEAMYELGLSSESDVSAALKWYEKAAKAGSPNATIKIAEMYDEGKGVEQDSYEAVRWYQKAARKGNEQAKERLVELNEIW